MTPRHSLLQLLQASFLMLIFISPILLINVNSPIHELQEQSIIADVEPLSIILMIGDGMGYEQVELARIVEEGMSGSLDMQHLTWNSTVVTYSADAVITDSAAAGTAISTGNKTNNRYIAMNPSSQPLETILEYAQILNKSTGIVTTATLYHATPACFMTHVNDRGLYGEITRQIVQEAEVDVLLGGGNTEFLGSYKTTMASNGYSIVYNRTDLASIASGKVLGLFTDGHMSYEQDRDILTEPSILEMTNKSLELLSQDTDGFFLMVEGARIDHAGHDWNKVNVALDTIAFNEAIQVAIDYVEANNNTILIVTADHETGGLAIVSNNLNTELPADLLTETEKRALRIERANNVTVSWTTTYHTNTSVPLYCYGSVFSELPDNYTIDNIDIFTLMKDYYEGSPLTVEEFGHDPITTTTSETTSSTTTTGTDTPTGTGTLLDSTMLAIVAVGAAVVVLVVFIAIRKR